MRPKETGLDEKGFSVIEVLVALVILSIVGLAAARNSIMSMVVLKRSIRTSVATQLAIEKLEELGSIDPVSLDSTDNSNETNLLVDKMQFTRTATITVNADGSRSVSVVVTISDAQLGGTHTASSRFPLWGNT